MSEAPTSNPYTVPPACIRKLVDLARQARAEDPAAIAQLQLAGELLDFAGGARALMEAQGLAHDWLIEQGALRDRELSGLMGAHWEHIPSWQAL
jgi:hypothetical protein